MFTRRGPRHNKRRRGRGVDSCKRPQCIPHQAVQFADPAQPMTHCGQDRWVSVLDSQDCNVFWHKMLAIAADGGTLNPVERLPWAPRECSTACLTTQQLDPANSSRAAFQACREPWHPGATSDVSRLLRHRILGLFCPPATRADSSREDPRKHRAQHWVTASLRLGPIAAS